MKTIIVVLVLTVYLITNTVVLADERVAVITQTETLILDSEDGVVPVEIADDLNKLGTPPCKIPDELWQELVEPTDPFSVKLQKLHDHCNTVRKLGGLDVALRTGQNSVGGGTRDY